MSLTTCPDCGREVSTSAPACIGCGRPVATESTPRSAAKAAFKLAILMFLIAFLLGFGAARTGHLILLRISVPFDIAAVAFGIAAGVLYVLKK